MCSSEVQVLLLRRGHEYCCECCLCVSAVHAFSMLYHFVQAIVGQFPPPSKARLDSDLKRLIMSGTGERARSNRANTHTAHTRPQLPSARLHTPNTVTHTHTHTQTHTHTNTRCSSSLLNTENKPKQTLWVSLQQTRLQKIPIFALVYVSWWTWR
jgi:hypothetical protein